MNIKTAVTSFVILTFPLFVYGQVSIAESGSATDKKSYTLFCNVTSFTGSATWTKDGTQLTTCVSSSFCSVDVLDVYTFSSNASGIQVVMNPVSSTIDGLWICTSSSGHFQELNVTSIRSSENTDEESTLWLIIGIVSAVISVCLIVLAILAFGKKRNWTIKAIACCCACCTFLLMVFPCYRSNKRKKTKIHTEDVEEIIYVKKSSNIEFGEHISNITNAKWEKDGSEVGKTHREFTMYRINNASVNHEGLYICTFGPNDFKLKYYLIVVGRTEMVYVEEHQDVELGKTISGIRDIPAVKWTRYKQNVNPPYLEGTKLKIRKASLTDEGKYVCTFGTKKNKLTYLLIIVGTEQIINVKEGIKIEFGKDIPDFDATFDANWMKDGSPVESTSQKKTFFQIDEVDENSKGLYVCTLGNKAELKYRLIKCE